MARTSRKTIAEGKYIALMQRGPWEFAHRIKGSGVVAIIAVTRDHELILTEQYRPPVQKNVIDLPAGLAGDIKGAEKEPLLKAAKRELLEETGYISRQWSESYTVPSSAGMSTEMVTLYIARNCQRKAAGGGDASESIRVHVIACDQLQAWLQRRDNSRTCIDPKVLAAIGLLSSS